MKKYKGKIKSGKIGEGFVILTIFSVHEKKSKGENNGEAIYEARPWNVFGEAPAMSSRGEKADKKMKSFTSEV